MIHSDHGYGEVLRKQIIPTIAVVPHLQYCIIQVRQMGNKGEHYHQVYASDVSFPLESF